MAESNMKNELIKVEITKVKITKADVLNVSSSSELSESLGQILVHLSIYNKVVALFCARRRLRTGAAETLSLTTQECTSDGGKNYLQYRKTY